MYTCVRRSHSSLAFSISVLIKILATQYHQNTLIHEQLDKYSVDEPQLENTNTNIVHHQFTHKQIKADKALEAKGASWQTLLRHFEQSCLLQIYSMWFHKLFVGASFHQCVVPHLCRWKHLLLSVHPIWFLKIVLFLYMIFSIFIWACSFKYRCAFMGINCNYLFLCFSVASIIFAICYISIGVIGVESIRFTRKLRVEEPVTRRKYIYYIYLYYFCNI